ncbi:MAG: BrnT family toxin [Acidimicrobiales bacterium]
MEILELLWDDHNIAHIARHQVTPGEVSEVILGAETLFFDADADRPGRLAAFGVTEGRRALAVYLATPVGGRSYPVTARPMTAKEERSYRQARGPEHG